MNFFDQIICPTWGLLEAIPGKIRSGDLVYHTEKKIVATAWKANKSYIYSGGGHVWSKEVCFKVRQVNVSKEAAAQ